MKFKKIEQTVEATQWFRNGDHPLDGDPSMEGKVVRYFRRPDVPGTDLCEKCGKPYHDHGWIDTVDNGHTVCPGDWIITEIYPCKPDVFAKTHKIVSESVDDIGFQETGWQEIGWMIPGAPCQFLYDGNWNNATISQRPENHPNLGWVTAVTGFSTLFCISYKHLFQGLCASSEIANIPVTAVRKREVPND